MNPQKGVERRGGQLSRRGEKEARVHRSQPALQQADIVRCLLGKAGATLTGEEVRSRDCAVALEKVLAMPQGPDMGGETCPQAT